jgi:hypothetical protein
MKLFFRLPGGGKRKPSALPGKRDTIFLSYGLPFVLITASQSSVLFAH